MSRKVYMASAGEYSDRSVLAIFSSSKKAAKYADDYYKANKETVDIDEWVLNEVENNFIATEVTMSYEGKVKSTRSVFPGVTGFLGWSIPYIKPKDFSWAVKTEDKERAIKVTNEKRTQIIALGLWGVDLYINNSPSAGAKKLAELNEEK